MVAVTAAGTAVPAHAAFALDLTDGAAVPPRASASVDLGGAAGTSPVPMVGMSGGNQTGGATGDLATRSGLTPGPFLISVGALGATALAARRARGSAVRH